jgi:hypothetical protein
MNHYLEYRRASYEIIMIGESKCSITLPEDVEYYVVDVFTRYMHNPDIPTDIIAIKLMTAINEKKEVKKQKLKEVADECVLIDGLDLNSRRWPTKDYYINMGKLAFENLAWLNRPPELFYEKVIYYMNDISKILHSIKMDKL